MGGMNICNNKQSLDKTKQQKAREQEKPEKKNSGQLIYKRELKILSLNYYNVPPSLNSTVFCVSKVVVLLKGLLTS